MKLSAIQERIDRIENRAQRQKNKLAAPILKSIKRLEKEIKSLNEDYEAVTGQSYLSSGSAKRGGGVKAGKKGGGGRKRVRRDTADLEKMVKRILKMLKGRTKDNALSGSDIRKKFPDVGPSVKSFLEKHGGEGLFKVGGSRKNSIYYEK